MPEDRPLPAPVKDGAGSGILTGVKAFALGGSHSLGLTDDGTVWAWGGNEFGQLGDGTSGTPRTLPTRVKDAAGTGVLAGIRAIAAGDNHSLAVGSDGKVWAWGRNDSGQLGDASSGNVRLLPVRVKDAAGTGVLAGIKSIAAGTYHSLALTADGKVWAWGLNDDGQLGDNLSAAMVTLPVAVKDAAGTGILTGVTAIEAGSYHNLALTSAGTVFAWGANDEGEVGDGTSGTDRPLPVQVKDATGAGAVTGVKAVAVGDYHSVALTQGGMVAAWGYNIKGQVGDGTSGTNRLLPVPVKDAAGTGALSGVQAIAAGGQFSLALAEGGDVSAWGENNDGELGDGTAEPGAQRCWPPLWRRSLRRRPSHAFARSQSR